MKRYEKASDKFKVICKKCGSEKVYLMTHECGECGPHVSYHCEDCDNEYDYHNFNIIEVDEE